MNIAIDKSRVLGPLSWSQAFSHWLRVEPRKHKLKPDPLPYGLVYEADEVGVTIRPAPRPALADFAPHFPLFLAGEPGFEAWD